MVLVVEGKRVDFQQFTRRGEDRSSSQLPAALDIPEVHLGWRISQVNRDCHVMYPPELIHVPLYVCVCVTSLRQKLCRPNKE